MQQQFALLRGSALRNGNSKKPQCSSSVCTYDMVSSVCGLERIINAYR